jgi:hypothetical protein
VNTDTLTDSNANDPSAGSPTDTMLRLSHSSDDLVHKTFQKSVVANIFPVRIIHRIIQSIEATGGVYKGQGRNQHELMTCAY